MSSRLQTRNENPGRGGTRTSTFPTRTRCRQTIEHFQHPITPIVERLPKGFTAVERNPGSGALDFIRGNLFDRAEMRPLPFSVPGFDNDLNEKLDRVMQRAVADEGALVYAFGERWGPEPGTKDKYFGS